MNTRPDPSSPGQTAITDLPENQKDAIRESIASFLADEPKQDDRGREIYLLEIQSAILMYLAPPDPKPTPEKNVRHAEHFAQEFEALAKSADSLSTTLEGLSEYSRSRFVETTRLDAESLEGLIRLSGLAASEASSLRRQLSEEQLPATATSKNPEIELIEKLSIVWTRHTRLRILRDREADGPWARFVEVACGHAGIDRDTAHRVRIRVYDSSALDESAEILATIPDL